MKKSIWLLAILLILCSWNQVLAETADGTTPADESVCDTAGLTGAPWGLCNAYCEAMDCDYKATDAADAACEKVKENFINKAGKVGLPCEVYGKPCLKQCSITYKEDTLICKAQFEAAQKACGSDSACYVEAKTAYINCNDNAWTNYQICQAGCTGNDCALECYDLKDKADDKCYVKYCPSADKCDDKYLAGCLKGNEENLSKCLGGCSIIIKDPIQILP